MSLDTRNRGTRSNSNFAVAIDGVFDGSYVQSASGGRTTREVVTHNMGPSCERPKSLGGKLKIEPIKLKVSLAMGAQLVEWINEAFKANPMYKNAVIYEANQRLQVVRTISASRCMISAVGIPAMDAGSGESNYIDITLQPEWVEYEEHATPQENLAVSEGMSKAKDWVCSNFLFNVQGMGNDAQQVNKLDAFEWKAVLKEAPICDDNYSGWVMTGFEMPQLKCTFDGGLNQYFDEMYKQFVHDGVCNEAAHRWADLEFKDLSGSILTTLRFDRLGIVGSPTGSYDAAGQDIGRKDVELYASNMVFELKSGSFDRV